MSQMMPELGLDDRASEAVEKAMRRHLANLTEITVRRVCNCFSDMTKPSELLDEKAAATGEAGDALLTMVADMQTMLDENPSLLTGWRDVMVDRMQEQMARTFDVLCNRMDALAHGTRCLALARLCEDLESEVLPKLAERMSVLSSGALHSRQAFNQAMVQSQLRATASGLCGKFARDEAARESAVARGCLWSVEWEECTSEAAELGRPKHSTLFMPVVQHIDEHCDRVAQVLPREKPSAAAGDAGASVADGEVSIALARASAQSVERGIEKMFKQKVTVYSAVTKPTVEAVMRVMCKAVMKAIVEGVRVLDMSQGAFGELQVASSALYVSMVRRGGHSGELDAVAEELASSMHERTAGEGGALGEDRVVRLAAEAQRER